MKDRAPQLDHLGIAVRSIEDALGFYQDALGFELSAIEEVVGERVRVAMLPADRAGARLELLEATDESSTIARFLEKRGPGLHHIALRVADLEAASKKLTDRGARLLDQPKRGAGGHLYVFVHPASAGGVLLELIQGQEEVSQS